MVEKTVTIQNAHGLHVRPATKLADLAGKFKSQVTIHKDGQDGFLVDPHGTGELSEAILRLIGDPELCRRFGRRGREKTLASFTWSKVTDAVEAIYAESLAGQRQRPRR